MSTVANGLKVKNTGKAHFMRKQVEPCMMANGNRTKKMARAC